MARPAWSPLLSLCRASPILLSKGQVLLFGFPCGPPARGLEWMEQGFALLDGHWLGRLPCGAQSQEQPAGLG